MALPTNKIKLLGCNCFMCRWHWGKNHHYYKNEFKDFDSKRINKGIRQAYKNWIKKWNFDEVVGLPPLSNYYD